ncbi:NHLP family bacteriocin export ABC transporter peptidase/permease/ATPase subunit [Nostoc sp. DedQUE02]|uniref:NHLP family bacteriocin export ABC transporter peptidase/permease/ATPase subunit n=1 Tax=Nostoc sp. DedQUE02 TaxID=3075388 RepID=UPI002AD227BF|nr:NHLP family bacteriocin export ABC transporter peptidase/permease/ATPase subunit [Nostoc sp. DedQUE03]MDZ7973847.1 NHLP family bacteriocin export ABC transporter peptidase/permease/ATPase subunit [Nostoc sp. DedQUE03]MDZ8048633.1 NHLP family bacteriocin export ABC transporter peptidase/permease/ATPase subunit [Nostoc sp. DedQUE02]
MPNSQSPIPKLKPNRVRTSTVLQMEAVECGAAALGIILSYYGRIVPLAKLREECGVSRDGSKAFNILKAAKNYGLNAKGLKLSLEKVTATRLPYIAFWNFNHFLVVEGYSKKRVYLNDPANGRRTVSWEEFDRAYTGVVLTMEPGADFQKGGKKNHIISALSSRLQNSRNTILFCLLAGLLLTLPRLAVPAFSQVFIDEILIQDRQDWLRPLLLGMLLTTLLRAFLARLRLTYLRRLMVKLSVSTSGLFLWHILRLPVGFYDQRFAGEISNRVQLNGRVAEVLSGPLATTIIDAVMMIFYLLIMIQYDQLLSAIAVGFALINILALVFLSQTRVDTNMRLAQEYGKVGGVTVSGIQTIETIKASGLESDLFARFAGYYAKALNAQQQLGLQTQILTTLPTILTALATASILLVGGLQVMKNNLSIGMLVAYQSLTLSFLEPVNSLVNFGSTLQTLEADLNRLDDVLQNPVDLEVEGKWRAGEAGGVGEQRSRGAEEQRRIINTNAPCPMPNAQCPMPHAPCPMPWQLQGHLELRNVTFGYSRVEPPLIENLSLTVKPGQRIALVGGSGSGKSTVAKLICGLYQPWDGEICFDGVERSQIKRSVLANWLAMVEQDIFLFAGTVRENITLWDSTVPEVDLVQACQDAAIHDAIASMPGKYDFELIEGGMNISGGQRQRLEIARALVRNPTILVLDEATSALDAETELIINRNLQQRGCSCIVVAHRLSTIRDCHEIIVLEQGKIVQRGTHEELWQQGGTYVRLLHAAEA